MSGKAERTLAGLAILLVETAAWAAEPSPGAQPDPRVAAALEAARLTYTADGADFRLDYKVDATRSQRVWVASGTARLDQLEIRDVWSVGARGKGALPPELATLLLKENARMILGAWQVNQGADEYLVVFSAPVDATAGADALQEVIEVVMMSTDRIEQQLSGKDEF